ncbi:MAG: hypothetical protein JWO80_5768 [Bryobacterales bacterium]|nr:hypothetical protein [Bryobacterales bacterium]
MSQSNAAHAEEGGQKQRAPRPPEFTVRVENLEIGWKNQGHNGDFYTTSAPQIRYKDEKSGEFKDGSSYGAIDLLALSEAAREPSAKICELSKAKGQGR